MRPASRDIAEDWAVADWGVEDWAVGDGERDWSVVRAYVLRIGAAIREGRRLTRKRANLSRMAGVRGIEMADIRQVTDRFAVAPQIALEDFALLASAGFRHVINNRPDGESPDQPSSAEAEAAARKAGLTYVYAPFVGQPTLDAVKAAGAADGKGKTLAYCRSGTRSVTAWALAQAGLGEEAQFIIESAAEVGYNLAPMMGSLRRLGAK